MKKNGLSEEEKKKVESFDVILRQSGCLLLIDIFYWEKKTPKFAEFVFSFLCSVNGDDYLSEEDEKLFRKGFARINIELVVAWYQDREVWMKKVLLLREKRLEIVQAILEKLKENKNPLSEWASEEIRKEIVANE